MTGVDWLALRAAATEVMRRAYAPYSGFSVGAAGLVDDGRTVVGCNVENASYGVTLCAECGVVSALQATGGGRLVALSCVDGSGEPLMPCGRCRQLLWEHGGPGCLVDAVGGPIPMAELLPHAFELEPGGPDTPTGGTVFVHPDLRDGQRVWTAYWDTERTVAEAPAWPDIGEAVRWARQRTARVVVVDEDGGMSWAGDGEPPAEMGQRWTP